MILYVRLNVMVGHKDLNKGTSGGRRLNCGVPDLIGGFAGDFANCRAV